MPQLVRHQLGASLLAAMRQEGLGVRDLFEGRQEPLSWFFRVEAYDQSELDILESGAVDTLHAPSALVELVVDEFALAIANVGLEGLASYLVVAAGGTEDPEEGAAHGENESPDPRAIAVDPSVLLGYLNLDVAPPALWLDDLEGDPGASERLTARLTAMARDVGADADSVEVHIEGALDAAEGWPDPAGTVRAAGVSVHFSFDIPLADTDERELGRVLATGAGVAARGLERMRDVFRQE